MQDKLCNTGHEEKNSPKFNGDRNCHRTEKVRMNRWVELMWGKGKVLLYSTESRRLTVKVELVMNVHVIRASRKSITSHHVTCPIKVATPQGPRGTVGIISSAPS